MDIKVETALEMQMQWTESNHKSYVHVQLDVNRIKIFFSTFYLLVEQNVKNKIELVQEIVIFSRCKLTKQTIKPHFMIL